MNGDSGSPGQSEHVNIAFRPLHHHVQIQRLVGNGPHLVYEVGTKGEVRNERSVHHIDMVEINTRRIELPDITFQIAQIGAHERWPYFQHYISYLRAPCL